MGGATIYCVLCGCSFDGCINKEHKVDISWMNKIVFLLNDVSKYTGDKKSNKIENVWHFDNYGHLIRSKIDATEDSPGSITHHESKNMNSIFLYNVQYHEYFAVHKSCWLVCNKPTPVDIAKKSLQSPKFGYKEHPCNTYQSQDFDMDGFITDHPDRSWMLTDPLTNGKNKIRILSHYHKFK